MTQPDQPLLFSTRAPGAAPSSGAVGRPRADDLVVASPSGLWCAAGGFHIDPHEPVPRAVITHAHADHLVRGCGSYLVLRECEHVARARLEASASVQTIGAGEELRMGGVRVSLHPAGHILGSAQVRIEPIVGGPTWVITGDCKLQPDPTCAGFEPVRCDVLVVESTFALPIYRFPRPELVAQEIASWWSANASAGRTSVLVAHSLGKAQRVARLLMDVMGERSMPGTLAAHPGVVRMCAAYARSGVRLPSVVLACNRTAAAVKRGGLVLTPPGTAATPWLRRFASAGELRLALASGWAMVRSANHQRAIDRSFALSDHADWPGLLQAVRASGAERVGVTHGSAEVLARYLAESMALSTFVLPTRFRGESAVDEPEDGASPVAEGSGRDGAEHSEH